jgi:hypothetical protein
MEIENFDGKWWYINDKHEKVRMLTDKECAEYIWGKDTPTTK